LIAEDSISRFYGVKFSPDSRWITYTRPARNNMSVVYLYDLRSRRETAVTEDWYGSSAPAFSTDGKYLIFASARDFNPIYSYTEWNHAYTNMEGVYIALLSKGTPSPFLEKDDKVTVETPKADESKASDKKKTNKKAKKAAATDDNATAIDLDGIGDRIIKLPLTSGNYGNFYCNGKKLWYNNGSEISVFDFAKQKSESFGKGILAVADNGKKAALLAAGRKFYMMDFPADKASTEKPVNLDRLAVNINYSEEWEQIYNEAWRAYRDGFYLENMHGVDWNKMHDKYAALLPYVKCRQDLSYVIGGLIGELACGHAYVDPGDFKGIDVVQTGMLGAEVSAHESGYFRIDHILKGAPYSKELLSPLTEIGLNVKEGDFIIAIDGVPTTEVKNIYALLEGKAGVPTELTINSTPSATGARNIVISPIADEYP
ncbi:MAG: PDZ domain-containing protein, partial [Muribaculaceae bacterium]